HRRVVDRWERHLAVFDEVLGRLTVVVAYVDTQHRHPAGAGDVVDLLQRGSLGPARSAPLTPDVDHDDLAGEIVDRHRADRIHQLRAGHRSRSAAVAGRVVEDVGLASGRDEFEGAALRDRVVTVRAADQQAGYRYGDERQPPRGQLSAGSLYSTSISRSPSYTSQVTEPTAQYRRRGSCQSRF